MLLAFLGRMDVGGTLKHFRKWTRMSIRDLAEKAGCSIAVISKIELNRISPTLRTLEKLCNAMGVTVADFLRPPAPPISETTLIRGDRHNCPLVMTWTGIRMLEAVPKTDIGFTALILQIEPGARTSSRRSLISHNQISFVLQGRVQLEIDDVLHEVNAMEGIYFNTVQDHLWINPGDTPAEVLISNPYSFTLFEQKEENLRWSLHLKREKKKKSQSIAAPSFPSS